MVRLTLPGVNIKPRPKNNNVFITLAASNHSRNAREEFDFYATPPEATQGLLAMESFQHKVMEPCCGMGHIAEVLKASGHQVTAFDLIDRGYGLIGDFLRYRTDETDFDIITNPPYKGVDDFVLHGLGLLKSPDQKMAMLLRVLYLEGKKRKKLFEKFPPEKIIVSSGRVHCAKNGDFEKYNTGALAYAWFIWRGGWQGETVVKWM